MPSLLESQSIVRLYRRLRRIRYRDGKYIVVTAMPKSGSTYLTHALADLAGYRLGYFGSSFKNIEQELYFPSLVDAYGVGTVVHQHFRANVANVELLKSFKIRPIILIRNVFDVVMSLRDHLLGEAVDNLPAVYPPPTFARLELGAQVDFIVDYVMPWYCSFFASWCEVERKKELDCLWLVYEEMIQDWPGTLERALGFLGFNRSRAEICAALDRVAAKPKERIRLNKGVIGRGQTTLSEAQKNRIRGLARHYPEIDFSRIGLGEGGGQRTEDGGRGTEDGGRKTEDGGRKTEGGGRRTEERP